MASYGWIKLHRGIADHWVWDCEFSYGQAWVDLLLKASHKPNKLTIKGQLIELDRGQQARSEVTLSSEWKWSRGKVRRFLKLLEKDCMISINAIHLTSIITICNYDSFQIDGTTDNTADSTANGHVAVHKQEVKKLRSEEERDLSSCDHDDSITRIMDRINELTGRNLSDQSATHRKHISARLADGHSVDDLLAVANTKATEWLGTAQQSYIVPETLFRPSNFDRYLAEAKMMSGVPTAEELVSIYQEVMPDMPEVTSISHTRRKAAANFCLTGKVCVNKFRAYLIYVKQNCTWVMNPQYGYGFDFLIKPETLERASNRTLLDRAS